MNIERQYSRAASANRKHDKKDERRRGGAPTGHVTVGATSRLNEVTMCKIYESCAKYTSRVQNIRVVCKIHELCGNDRYRVQKPCTWLREHV